MRGSVYRLYPKLPVSLQDYFHLSFPQHTYAEIFFVREGDNGASQVGLLLTHSSQFLVQGTFDARNLLLPVETSDRLYMEACQLCSKLLGGWL